MSLLEEAMESFIILEKTQTEDGYGAMQTTWSDGSEIQGAFQQKSDLSTKIAQAMGSKNVYSITVSKDILLDFHTVLRRESNSKIYRITNNTDDFKTPDSAFLNMRQYTIEEWSLADE